MLPQNDDPALGPCLDEYTSISNPVLLTTLLTILAAVLAALVGVVFYDIRVMLLAWAVAMALLGWGIWLATGRKVAIHQHGVRLISRRGERPVRWEDITEVR